MHYKETSILKWYKIYLFNLKEASTWSINNILIRIRLGYTTSITFVFQYYYSIKEISVGGRCVCNGHAFVCPPSAEDPDLLQCQCQHNTAGLNCDKCAEGYVQKRYVGLYI